MRLIDGDKLLESLLQDKITSGMQKARFLDLVRAAPTVGKDTNVPSKWISVKERLPEEHPSMFYKLYGTEKWSGAMWRTESDRVLVAIKFPDGTRTVDKGKLQDGMWRTGVSPVIPQEVTHWALWPEPPKEETGNE